MDMGRIDLFNNVEDTKILVQWRVKLWNSIFSWRQNTEKWQVSRFDDVDVEDIREQATQQAKIVLQCERHLPAESSAVQYLKKLVFEFKETMPIVEALGSKHLKEVHWAEIKGILQIGDFPLEAKDFSLGELVDFNVAQYADDIENIAITAGQEHELGEQLASLKEIWRQLDFEVAKHKDKDAYKLVSVDKVQAVLDESMQISSSIVGSRYVKRLQKDAQEMQDRLTLIFETLEEWRVSQRNWLYLERVFSSGDIKKQRDKDYQDYDRINKDWGKLMKNMMNSKGKEARNVRTLCSGSDRHYEGKGSHDRERLDAF